MTGRCATLRLFSPALSGHNSTLNIIQKTHFFTRTIFVFSRNIGLCAPHDTALLYSTVVYITLTSTRLVSHPGLIKSKSPRGQDESANCNPCNAWRHHHRSGASRQSGSSSLQRPPWERSALSTRTTCRTRSLLMLRMRSLSARLLLFGHHSSRLSVAPQSSMRPVCSAVWISSRRRSRGAHTTCRSLRRFASLARPSTI